MSVGTKTEAGQIFRANRGRHAVPGVHAGTTQALEVSRHACLVATALSYGWEVKMAPAAPQVAVPKDRRLSPEARRGIQLIWSDLGDHEVEGLSTSPATALAMCGRRLPFDGALAIFDSAPRLGFSRSRLVELADAAKGPGSARLRRVASPSGPRAANSFESVVRAMGLDVTGPACRAAAAHPNGRRTRWLWAMVVPSPAGG